jgi:hypothetical protein
MLFQTERLEISGAFRETSPRFGLRASENLDRAFSSCSSLAKSFR